jgi:two-component system response regulator FixJ
MSGLDLQAELAARQIALPIIMMSAYAEIPMAVRAMKGGAIDFLEKPIDGQALLDRIAEMVESDRQACLADAKLAKAAKELARLTPRQRQVLDGLLAGKRNKIIADELGLSPKTVDVHRFRIMQRLEVDSLSDLIRLALSAPQR